MEIAYCIIAHENSPILQKTIELLASNHSNIYLHIDKKVNIHTFDEYKNKVIFTSERIDIRWGSISQVDAMLLLIKEANSYDYDYLFILSGDCLPLKNSKQITMFLEKNAGYEYIGITGPKLEDRVKYNYTKSEYKKRKNMYDKIIIKVFNYIKNWACINKKFTQLPKIYKGSNWIGITKQFSIFVSEYLKKNPEYRKAFEKSLCADEIFFQTLIMDSQFKNMVYRYGEKTDPITGDNFMCLRYIDWSVDPGPKVLTEEDFFKMRQSNALFARKIDKNIDLEKFVDYFKLSKTED